MQKDLEEFIRRLQTSLANDTFVKLTLGRYSGPDDGLQKLQARRVSTKKGDRLFVLFRYGTRDTTKNFSIEDGVSTVRSALSAGFRSGHLFTTANDLQLEIGKKGRTRLNVAKPTFTAAPTTTHDRQKHTLIDQNAFYLKALGITDDAGRVRDREQDKWRQINKFVEILGGLIDRSSLRDRPSLKAVDMGSGKGYLTFAAYDHLNGKFSKAISMTGVDTRRDLVELDNGIAAASGFDGLTFLVGSIIDYPIENVDILIALHACNTATDDAIYKGISSGADLIIVAPCCHQEVRPQIKSPAMLADVLKHGTLMERTAETLTDGLRSLLMERSGYSVKMIEFVGIEHTPKNNMLVATRNSEPSNVSGLQMQIDAIKREFGITHHRLETLLSCELGETHHAGLAS